MKNKEFKPGQTAWSIELGPCRITDVEKDHDYPIKCCNANGDEISYTLDGLYTDHNHGRSLFHTAPFNEDGLPILSPENSILMMVGDFGCSPDFVRFVCGQLSNGRFITYSDADVFSEINPNEYTFWKYAKHIQQPQEVELSMDEIAQKFGIDVSLLKIKK
jgi:hypothetical protein